jgi:hypothetical protein
LLRALFLIITMNTYILFHISHKVGCVFCFPQRATVSFLIYSQVQQQQKVSDV